MDFMLAPSWMLWRTKLFERFCFVKKQDVFHDREYQCRQTLSAVRKFRARVNVKLLDVSKSCHPPSVSDTSFSGAA